MRKTKVLIADDHALVREGIIAFLKSSDEFEVVGEAANGMETIEKAVSLKPDIILMDIAMPGLGGLEATIEIKKHSPEIKIIVLTQYDDREYLSRFLKAGVSGYLLKRSSASELISAVKAVSKGQSYLSPSVASDVIEGYLGKKSEAVDPYELLTDREKQILKLIAEGMTHKEIASTLGISTKTVIAHQTHISEKLGIHTKAEIIKFAIAKNIIKL